MSDQNQVSSFEAQKRIAGLTRELTDTLKARKKDFLRLKAIARLHNQLGVDDTETEKLADTLIKAYDDLSTILENRKDEI